MPAAAFLDRDGVLNVDIAYLGSADQLIWMAGAQRAVRLLKEAGFYVFVVTNQSGVARGFFDEQAVQALHAEMQRQLQQAGTAIDEFAYCPHLPDGADPRYAMSCDCRKPAPGMLLKLIEKYAIDPGASLMIGDKDSDMAAALSAGVVPYLFRAGTLDSFVERILSERASDRTKQCRTTRP